jgi:hypothetical protein
VYAYASAVLVVDANVILVVVEVGKEIRLAVVLVGDIVTWYSIEGPQYI